tara:strand:+ start:352 stop:1995 length:1644 start_codon:yes stop_codon:yes gene_type:complete
MAITAQELNVILSARDKQFTKAMDRAQRRVERFSKKSQKDLSKTSRAFSQMSASAKSLTGALTFGASLAALQQMVKRSTDAAFEIDRLSQLAGVGVERFQELSFAARSVGVNQEKLADILKDTNDKFGDFFVTGAGPLADFFESIAPKIGLTAEAFRGLSSDQALGLFVKSLEQANVNQQELTFFMEALASDATLLAPLFVDNANALNSMSTEARELGAVIDADLIKKTTALRTRFNQVIDSMSSKFNEFAMNVVFGFDAIFNISETEQLFEINKALEKVQEERSRLSETIRKLNTGEHVKLGFGQTRESKLEKTLKQLQKQNRIYNELIEQQLTINNAIEKREQLEARLTDMTIRLHGANVSVEDTNKEVKILTKSLDDLDTIAGTLESSFESVFMAAIEGSKSFKDTLRSTAATVIRELYRVLVVQQLVNKAMGFFGLPVTPTASVGGNAAGGPVYAGQATVVGEHGRELFVPSTAGRILSVPQAKAAVSGGDGVMVQQTINITTGVQQTVRNEIRTLMPQIAESTKAAVADAKRRGGSYGRAFS